MTFLAITTVKVALILGAALGACALLRHRSASARHWVLAAAIGGAAILPVLAPIVPAWPVTAPPAVAGRTATGSGHAAPAAATPATDISGRRSHRGIGAGAPRLPAILTGIWLSGVMVCGLLLAVGVARLASIASHARRLTSGPWVALAREVGRAAGLRREIRLLHGPQPALLVTWGVARPTILLPSAALHWSDERIRVVLAHEIAHIRRRDWLVLLLAQVVLAIHWCNPLAWIACRRLREESERACDDQVIAGGIDPSTYATHLVELARLFAGPRAWSATPAMAQPCSLERRIAAMLNARADRTHVTRPFRVVTAVSALAVAVALSGAALAQPDAARFAGSVSDPSGAPLPDATITLTHRTTTAGHAMPTDQGGAFRFDALPAGEYTLEARAQGFATIKETIDLQPGATVQRDIRMNIGSVEESITVRGPSPQPQMKTSEPRAVAGILEKIKGWRLQPPIKTRDVRPIYTAAMVDAGIEGQVVLDSRIGVDGSVIDIRVVRSAHEELTRAARDAVSQWRFEPTRLWGTPVEAHMIITCTFERQPR